MVTLLEMSSRACSLDIYRERHNNPEKSGESHALIVSFSHAFICTTRMVLPARRGTACIRCPLRRSTRFLASCSQRPLTRLHGRVGGRHSCLAQCPMGCKWGRVLRTRRLPLEHLCTATWRHPNSTVCICNHEVFEVDMALSVTGKVDQRDTASGSWPHIRQTCTLACEWEHEQSQLTITHICARHKPVVACILSQPHLWPELGVRHLCNKDSTKKAAKAPCTVVIARGRPPYACAPNDRASLHKALATVTAVHA